MIRVASEASFETIEVSHSRIAACTSWACSVLATFPVPIALVYLSAWELIEVQNCKLDSLPDWFICNDYLRPIFDAF